MPLQAGDKLDRYTLIAPLGSGGQASVWRVTDPLQPNQAFAAKLVLLALTPESSVERVRREARQLVRLAHPSLVPCHALFEDLQHEVLGVVMSFVDGESLDAALDRQALTAEHKWWLLRHLAAALGFVHQRQIVHRDVKLPNVLLAKDFFAAPARADQVKLVDFGIAAPLANPNPITQVGHVVGTPAYLAPEAIEPRHWRFEVGPALDVFAFGVLAWRVFIGGHPSGLAPGASLLDYAREYRAAALSTNWPPATGDVDLDRLLRGTLAIRADQRLPNGDALAQLLGTGGPGLRTVYQPDLPAPCPPEQPSVSTGSPHLYSVRQAPRAEGGSSPALSVRTDSYAGPAGPPALPAYTPPRPGQRSRSTGAALLTGTGCGVVALLGLAASVAVAFSGLFDPAPASRGTSQPPATTLVPTSQPAQPPTPTPTGTTAPAPLQVLQPASQRPASCPTDSDLCSCCPGEGCCPSGHDCLGSCGDRLEPNQRFVLRYAGGGSGTRSLEKALPRSQVCVSVSGTSRRTCIHSSPGHPDHTNSLSVSGYDLSVRGLDVEVRSAWGFVVSSRAGYRQTFTRSVLCKGFNITRLSGDPAATQVGFFLDAPGSDVPQRCTN